MKRILQIVSIVLLAFTIKAQPPFVKDSISNYITREMKAWDLPGLSVVIVKDGKIAFMKGFGVKDISTKQLVDENTLFMIASNTKLFTGTALALLDHRKQISLNDRIIKYFPSYRLYDSMSTALVSVRDMLTHRIGTITFQGDFTFWNSGLSRSEIMNRMRLLAPSNPFRQDFGYCNSCYLVAGEVIYKVTKQPWEVFVYDSIVAPLEMRNTHMLSAGIEQRPNVATPYTTAYTGKLNKVPYDQWDNIAPAASIVSSVSDLAHWLSFQLDSGKYKGRQVLPFVVLQKTRDMVTPLSSRKSSLFPVHLRGYGLGLNMSDYNGRQIYWHTGGAGGMVSNVCFVPEERLGIAILTNNDNQSLFEALRYQILDAYLDVPYVNRSRQMLSGFTADMQKQLKEISDWKARVKGNPPSLPLSAYTGRYTHPLYGEINIEQTGNKLLVRFQQHQHLTATLEHMDNNDWLMEYNNIEYGIFSTRFTIENNKVQSVTIKFNEYVEFDPYEFKKL